MKVSLSTIPSALTAPVMDGTVSIEGAEIEAIEAQSVDGNSRNMLSLQFDVAEMSFATYLKAKEEGVPLTGIPIFTGRRFLQPCIAFSTRSLVSLSALKGCRVGLPQFWMTSSVWHRGLLEQEYGVRSNEVNWVTTTIERLESQQFPPGVHVTLKEGGGIQGLKNMLQAGEIDVMLSPRPTKELEGIRVPFENVVQVQKEYYRRTGVLPIMHFLVMREQLASEQPGLAGEIYRAFEQAKQLAYAGAHAVHQVESPLYGVSFTEAQEVFAGDPWPYGVEENRHVLETFLGYAVEQGLLRQAVQVDQLFAPEFRK